MKNEFHYEDFGHNIALRSDITTSHLSKVEKLIFDCDGVLVNDKESYRQTIIHSVDFYFLNLLSFQGKEKKLVNQDDIQKSKDTGAFNNDWKLTHAFIAYYLGLTILQLKDTKIFEKIIFELDGKLPIEFDNFSKKIKRYGETYLRKEVDIKYLLKMKNNEIFGISKFRNIFHQNPELPVLKGIELFFNIKKEQLEIIRRLCPYDIEKSDLLRRLFDEIYLGSNLFYKFTNRRPKFNFPNGLIQKETIIPSLKTLAKLREIFGPLGIYSERPRNEGLYILKKLGLLEYFDRETLIFNDEIKAWSQSNSIQFAGKPNARAFVSLLEKIITKNHNVAYIGDTISDALMIRNAKDLGRRNLIFIGTLSSSASRIAIQKRYMELGAEAIVKDVNSIVTIFDKIRQY
ncbi:MAG: HAD family hydrolase [Candidatus Bathyarchaeia archaeon]